MDLVQLAIEAVPAGVGGGGSVGAADSVGLLRLLHARGAFRCTSFISITKPAARRAPGDAAIRSADAVGLHCCHGP